MRRLLSILNENQFTVEDVKQLEEKLFAEGVNRRIDLKRFAVLLFISAVIAS